MVELIFDTGSPTTTNPLSINATVVYGTDYSEERYNQHSQRIATGELRVYDSGVTLVKGVIKMKNVTYNDGQKLKQWLMDDVKFQLNKFSITPLVNSLPADIDLGLGKQVPITDAQFTSKSLKGVLKYVNPGIYEVSFPYLFIRS